MTRTFFFILFLFLSLLNLSGCRASKELKARNERTSTEETSVELRRADSLWSSLAERFNFKIEFYPPDTDSLGNLRTLATVSPRPAAPSSTMPAGIANPLPRHARGVGAGGMGAVKSIEFTAESTAEITESSQVDSTYYNNSAATATLQTESASERRQDNSTVAIIVVVFAVAAFAYALVLKGGRK